MTFYKYEEYINLVNKNIVFDSSDNEDEAREEYYQPFINYKNKYLEFGGQYDSLNQDNTIARIETLEFKLIIVTFDNFELIFQDEALINQWLVRYISIINMMDCLLNK